MIKWCVIGAGGIADRRTIPAILSDKNNKLVAIMEKAEALCKTLGEKYGVPAYTDEETMLKECDCDVAQSRVTHEPKVFKGENGNLYLKQIANFCEHINNNDIDYSYADEAVHV